MTLRATQSRAARLTVGFAAAVGASILFLVASGAAGASSTWPSQHWASASCYRTSITNTWTVMSNVYMNRADGYPPSVFGMGGGTITGGAYWTVIDGHSQQWLYYQVVVATPNSRAAGGYDWTYGSWLRAKDALGDGTSGLDTEVLIDGRWVRTGYTIAGSPWDVSYANGYVGGIALRGSGKKYVYAHYYWGPITNLKGDVVFGPYEVYEPLGWMTCY